MNGTRWIGAIVIAICSASSLCMADEIEVQPGEGTITAALVTAKPGDTLKLFAGEYVDSFELGDQMRLVGAGADKTVIIGTGYAVVNCIGNECRIMGVEIRGSDETIRGVNTSNAVRIERCRFRDLPEAIAMMGAPLSDVVYCDFVDCGIGVRAIGGASPTVWGCRFEGGSMGIFGMDGGPYVRQCLFDGCNFGIRLITDRQTVIRNNVFMNCESAGVELQADRFALGYSVRNNVFASCGSAIICPTDTSYGLSHAVIHECGSPAIRDRDGKAIGDAATTNIQEIDPELTVDEQGRVAIGAADTVVDMGIRLCTETEGTRGTIGLDGLARPGCDAPDEAFSPRVRFEGLVLLANCVNEEYAWMQLKRLPRGMQSLTTENGVQMDVHEGVADGKPTKTKFEISRFFGELGLQP